MPRRTGPTDPNVKDLINQLKKLSSETKIALWKTVAEKLENSRRQRTSVNLSKINRNTKEGDIVIIPGTVLSSGDLEHTVTIAALKASEMATEKIKNSKSTFLSIKEFMGSKPEISKTRIIV